MSTATAFATLGVFRDCYAEESVPPVGSNDPGEHVYFGPFTLTQAMALYWNTESITAHGQTFYGYLSLGPAAPPRERVCGLYAGGPSNIFALNNATDFYEIAFESQVLAIDGYYIPVSASFEANGGDYLFSLNPTCADDSDLVLITSYPCTIFGAAGTIYLYHVEGPVSTPGNPSFAMVANYYTY